MAGTKQYREIVKEVLPQIKSAEDVYNLFKFLDFPPDTIFDPKATVDPDEFGFSKEDRSKVARIYTVMSFGKDLPVFLLEGKFGSFAGIRSLVSKFHDRYLQYLLILTQDYTQVVFVFPHAEQAEGGKKRLKLTKLIIDPSELYWSDSETIANLRYPGKGKSYRDVWIRWREAFNVEKVTKRFFEDFQKRFRDLRDSLQHKMGRKDSHAFALQFLNRLMFVYFVSKKGWLNNSLRFLRWYWNRYKTERRDKTADKDSFYEIWLKQLYFNAFNNNAGKIRGLPKDVKDIISNFPYLNGGLFLRNEFDDKFESSKASISDNTFESVFNFFESFHFTIKEDMPLESEVAVDPQMIGYVYESLANVAEEIYDRKDLGIFYTPRAEVDFMCKRTLVEYLIKQLPDVPKKLFYIFVFDDDRKEAEEHFSRFKLWDKLEEKLDDLDVIDPACGSGAFLVGMLNALTDLYKVIYKHIEREYARRDAQFDFNIKHRIIMNSLYGVDVMPWAVHAAELRLWLQMIIESTIDLEDRSRPLLPNLDLNLRVGDSLVQEIGGVQYDLRKFKPAGDIGKRLAALKHEKADYFRNVRDKLMTRESFVAEESRIFEEIVKDKIDSLKDEKQRTEKNLKAASVEQSDLLNANGKKHEAKIEELQERLDALSKDISSLNGVLKNLDRTGKRDFVWEIDFAEISGEKDGFDIVIGNPPYVRQENISPPNKLKAEVDKPDRDEYKDKLQESVLIKFPQLDKIDRKSDYYIYFYYRGLSLLNEKGTFCFITSNSWLDVGYGAGFQEFMLKYVAIIGIYDCTKRTFEHADINTVIVILAAPVRFKGQYTWSYFKQKGYPRTLDHTAKFVVFYQLFEQMLSSETQIEIAMVSPLKQRASLLELVGNIYKPKSGNFRVFPLLQEDLLEDGWEYPKGELKAEQRFLDGKYVGNKWGGKYLRAPDIYWKILEKGKDKLVRLGDIAEVRRGFTTGANEFFYLQPTGRKAPKGLMHVKNGAGWEGLIEEEFLKPVIKSPTDCASILIQEKDLRYNVFMCNAAKRDIKGSNSLNYIAWGERNKFQSRPTCASRDRWWQIEQEDVSILIFKKGYGNIFMQNLNPKRYYVDQTFYIWNCPNAHDWVYLLNSTAFVLFLQASTSEGLGGGLLRPTTDEIERILYFNLPVQKKVCDTFKSLLTREMKNIFDEVGISDDYPIRSQKPNPLPDRKALDDVIFDTLGLTQEERNELYWSVCELVKARLDKAKTFKEKKG